MGPLWYHTPTALYVTFVVNVNLVFLQTNTVNTALNRPDLLIIQRRGSVIEVIGLAQCWGTDVNPFSFCPSYYSLRPFRSWRLEAAVFGGVQGCYLSPVLSAPISRQRAGRGGEGLQVLHFKRGLPWRCLDGGRRLCSPLCSVSCRILVAVLPQDWAVKTRHHWILDACWNLVYHSWLCKLIRRICSFDMSYRLSQQQKKPNS